MHCEHFQTNVPSSWDAVLAVLAVPGLQNCDNSSPVCKIVTKLLKKMRWFVRVLGGKIRTATKFHYGWEIYQYDWCK